MRPSTRTRTLQYSQSQQDVTGSAGKGQKVVGGKRGITYGIAVYLALVLAAFVLGKLQPLQPAKAKSVPLSSRTICKRPPEAFDAAQASGKSVLITGAAGFIGSHVARHVTTSKHCLALHASLEAYITRIGRTLSQSSWL